MENLYSKLPPPQNPSKQTGSQVLYHWYAFFENFNTSSAEFYQNVESALSERQVPGLELSREVWNEGGLLSQKREYLRLTRERWVFDICAAPFGTGYFFSCRFCHIPAPINPFALIAIALGVWMVFRFLIGPFGFFGAVGLLIVGAISLIWLLRNVVSLGLADLDALLVQSKIFAPIYERFFRKETYFRTDTRIMYLETVPAAVKEIVEKVTQAKGSRLAPLKDKPVLNEMAPSA